MSLHRTSRRVNFRWIFPLCTIMVCAILSLVPIGVAAQVAGDRPALSAGLHDQVLLRTDEPPISYAISIPANYSPSTPVPLILALHFGVGGGDATGAGGDVVEILVGPALEEL